MPQNEHPEDRKGERIAKLLARAGIASRREVERMIAEGRVKLGDEVITTPATVLANLKGVMVDDKPVRAPEPPRLFAFHKPDGLITAERDPAGRPTIYTALRNALPPGTPRMMPVGRLDLNTEGLLLLTNDGELKRAMELPATGIPRTYRARTFGEITQARLEELIEGVTIEGMNYGRIDANMERRTGRNQWIELTLTEGKNREVRRVLEHLGLQVSRLIRVAYGPFLLGELQRGAAVEIRQKDVEQFRKSLKLAPAERGEATRGVPPAGDAPVSRAPGRSAARSADKPAARRDGHANARPDRRDPQEKTPQKGKPRRAPDRGEIEHRSSRRGPPKDGAAKGNGPGGGGPKGGPPKGGAPKGRAARGRSGGPRK
jgi:23S rRNA pseudouridine2605 synthase